MAVPESVGGQPAMARNGAEPASNGKGTLSRRSDRFLTGLEDATAVTFVSHINPDPDSLGSMMGLAHLVETALGKPTRLTQDGLIGRAENRAMVKLLDIDLEPIDDVAWREGEVIVMVDSQPKTGRHSVELRARNTERRTEDCSAAGAPRSEYGAPLHAVIDHHDTPGDLDGVPFVDVRRSLGATCSLVTSYLIEQNIALPKRLATGLLYG